MFLLVESGDQDSGEESGEGTFKTNIYLANHYILFNSLPKEISIQDTGFFNRSVSFCKMFL